MLTTFAIFYLHSVLFNIFFLPEWENNQGNQYYVILCNILRMLVFFCFRFQAQYGTRAQTALPYAMNSEFSRVMATQMVCNFILLVTIIHVTHISNFSLFSTFKYLARSIFILRKLWTVMVLLSMSLLSSVDICFTIDKVYTVNQCTKSIV